MPYEVIDCSPQAKLRQIHLEFHEGAYSNDYHFNLKYPFPFMVFGKSFAVPFADAKEFSLRQRMSQFNRQMRSEKSTRLFTFIIHPEIEKYEISRIR